MSFQKFKSDSHCVGGTRRSATKKFYGDITFKGIKVLIVYCSVCKRTKSMTVSDNTILAEALGDFFKNLGKKGLNEKKLAQNVLKTQVKPGILQQTMLVQLLLETLKQLYQRYQI